MKKVFKKLFTLFCVLTIIFSCVGCNGITLLSKSNNVDLIKQASINSIDSYLTEIYEMNLPYSLILIEHEAKSAKESIENLSNSEEIIQTTQKALAEMKNLVAPDFVYDFIKYESTKHGGDEKFYIRYYLGSKDGYYYVLMGNIYFPVFSLTMPIISRTPPEDWDTNRILFHSVWLFTKEKGLFINGLMEIHFSDSKVHNHIVEKVKLIGEFIDNENI